MAVGYSRGDIEDYMGCITASKHHEVVVYEGRGESMEFLIDQSMTTAPMSPKRTTAQRVAPGPMPLSGTEKLQRKISEEGRRRAKGTPSHQLRPAGGAMLIARTFARLFGNKTLSPIHERSPNMPTATIPSTSLVPLVTQKTPTTTGTEQPSERRTMADKGLVSPPKLKRTTSLADVADNAFSEFVALTKATIEATTHTCRKILDAYHHGSGGLLRVLLAEEQAAIIDNTSHTTICGSLEKTHMAAYHAAAGFVHLCPEETRRIGFPIYETPSDDPVVVVAKLTEVWLSDRVLERAHNLSKALQQSDPGAPWRAPTIEWIDGVPGCGKSTWVADSFREGADIIVTTTIEAAEDLRGRLAHRVANVRRSVRTMASLLANGVKPSEKQTCQRLLIDEALMNHLGAIVMAARIAEAGSVVMVGDQNQIPYIERGNLFTVQYHKPEILATTCQALRLTHRCSLDVVHALSTIYRGMYSSNTRTRSLKLVRGGIETIPKDTPDTLYLVHMQNDKRRLVDEGFGVGSGSRILSIHEAQGLTSPNVIIVRKSSEELNIYSSVAHAVVAISRHIETCVYYTAGGSDAVGMLIGRTVRTGEKEILETSLKGAISVRDLNVADKLIRATELLRQQQRWL